jgi:succinoglycan biosynthesis protein ExoA
MHTLARFGGGKEAGASDPAVSVVVPCRNERHHIESCVRSILGQEPPCGGFEVIAVDGLSDDGTRQILTRLANENPRLRIVDNPGRTAPCGRNMGVRSARGKYIAILDAHSEYAPDYLRSCVELLEEHPEICCSGGPIISQGNGIFGQAVAMAMSHPVGIGNAKHRLPNYEGYAEGACFPMFRKQIFDKVGLFDETLVRNQDDEFNFRIARTGGKIFISPRAQCTYYVRESPSQLLWQYCQYGYWRIAVLRKHRRPASIRHIAPVTFLSLLLISLVAGLFLPVRWRLAAAAAFPATYIGILFMAALGVAMKKGVKVGLAFPIAAIIMHTAYAAGFLWGIATMGRKNERMSRLSREAS